MDKLQQMVIASIKNELLKKNRHDKPSSFWHSVWFHPSEARFLYGDMYVEVGVIEPLISSGVLVFKCIEPHQGEKMLRYVLSPNEQINAQ